MLKILVALLGALVLSLVASAGAGADSIVFMKSGDVWIAHSDGSGARPFTLHPFHWGWPSEADDGTIVVAGGDGHAPYGFPGSDLYRFSGNGNQIGGPIPTPGTYYTLACPTLPPNSVRVSPDGSKIAYGSTLCSSGSTALWTPSNSTGLDWPNQNGGLGVQDYSDPDWIDNTHFSVSHPGATIGTQPMWGVQDTGSAASGPGWYEPGATGDGFQGIIARTGKIAALFEDDAADWAPAVPHSVTVWLYTAANLADAEANGYQLQCKLALNAAQSSDPFDYSPTFSPDGTKLLWGDDRGVEIATVSDLSASNGGCTHVSPQLLVPGASQPFYAAGNMQAQAPNPDQPGGTTPPPPPPSPLPPKPLPPKPLRPKPTARFAVNTKRARAHRALVFDASASKVVGKATYTWSFGDHKTAKGRRVTHRYRKAGTFTVTLTVTDAGGSKTIRIKIKVRR